MPSKVFKIPSSQIKPVAPGYGACIASDHIVVDGKPVGYMYREEPMNTTDSGWRFFSGEEPREYIDNPENLAFYDINTIANYDAAIIPYLRSPLKTAFGRVPGTAQFEEEEFFEDEE